MYVCTQHAHRTALQGGMLSASQEREYTLFRPGRGSGAMEQGTTGQSGVREATEPRLNGQVVWTCVMSGKDRLSNMR